MEAHRYFVCTGGEMYIVKLPQAAQPAGGGRGRGEGGAFGGGGAGGRRFCQAMWKHVRTACYAPGDRVTNGRTILRRK